MITKAKHRRTLKELRENIEDNMRVTQRLCKRIKLIESKAQWSSKDQGLIYSYLNDTLVGLNRASRVHYASTLAPNRLGEFQYEAT